MKKQILPTLLGLACAGQVFGAKVIPNHAAANLVLGQTDFVSAVSPSVRSSFSLTRPEGVIVDPVTGKVFVSDYDNARILRYPNVASLTNGAGAEAVFGKPSFSQNISTTAANTLGGPIGIFLDRYGRLWVADSPFHRVLMFEAAVYRSDQPTADKVLGQPDFTTSANGTTASKMYYPYGIWLDASDRLWVADQGNNRILRFDTVSAKSNGSNANGVLGQSDFTTSASGLSSSKMSSPQSVTLSSSGVLYVTDTSNNRVLVFQNAASLGNGAGASGVLGQTDFTTGTSNLTATGMNYPNGIFLTASDSLWVTESFNRRIIRFDNVASKSNGASANGILCQPDFVTNAAALDAKGSLMGAYGSPFVDGAGALWVADTDHHRVLRFPADVTKPLLTLTGTPPKKTTKKNVTIKGTASDTYGISKVQYRIGNGTPQTATGTTSWQFTAPLKNGKNTITIFATDSVGNVSLNKVVKIKRS